MADDKEYEKRFLQLEHLAQRHGADSKLQMTQRHTSQKRIDALESALHELRTFTQWAETELRQLRLEMDQAGDKK